MASKVCLSVEVHEKNLLAFGCQDGTDSGNRSCLSDTAFMVGHGYDFSFHIYYFITLCEDRNYFSMDNTTRIG